MKKPVLGLFANEDELRDAIADKLHLLEPGLQYIDKNYAVQNLNGANGSLDILAKDKYGNFVVIEVKRSDAAARQALHELSKYVSLFLEDQQVDSQKIRCFVVSTDWHELDVPLSYFRESVDVDVKGFLVEASGHTLKISERTLPSIDRLPKLCPDARFVFFETEDLLRKSAEQLREKTKDISHIRAALLLLEHDKTSVDRANQAVLCVWRIRDVNLEDVASYIGLDDRNFPHSYYEGWEAEFALLNWLIEQCEHVAPPWKELSIATAEKISSTLERRQFTNLIRLGNWSPKDLVNDLQEVQRCLVAKDVSSVGRRANRHLFNKISSPKTGKSWEYSVSSFLSFISFVGHWQSEVENFLKTVPVDCDVEFFAQDCRHIHYRIYQRLHDERADLSQFKITVKRGNGGMIRILGGGWAWDGSTHPSIALNEIRNAYDSLDWSRIALFSAVDTRRYESAYYAHGFYPYVIEMDYESVPPTGKLFITDSHPEGFDIKQGLGRFVECNVEYCNQIADLLAGIPLGPDGSGAVLIKASGQ
ncbi:endonuclease NucS domain-containing protein [Burkholderia pyrrocinia]|uniref:endonuclease NucS domain-containing protein n=1 Tax=Burkholderia pyrrocinia TaxID=60550 RepID=UPI00158A6973|nr:endonuclease NucS domain-containing protein [Burkholderia pyrrocinia]